MKIVGIALVAILVIIIVIYWSSHSKEFFKNLSEVIHSLVEGNKWYSNLIFVLIQVIFSWVILPGAMYFDIMFVFYMKSFWRPFLIIFLSNCAASQLSFFLIRFQFREKFEKKFGNTKILKAIKHEVEQSPWTASVIISLVLIPMAIKNYSVPLTNMTYEQYALPSVPIFAFYAALIVHTGLALTQIKDLFQQKSFSSKSPGQKFELIVNWILIVFTIILMGVVGRKLYNRFKSYNEEEERDKKSFSELSEFSNQESNCDTLNDELDDSGTGVNQH